MSNKLKNVGFIGHIPSGGITNAERILIEQLAKNDLGLIIVDEKPRGINIKNLRDSGSLESLLELEVEETKQLLMTINESHPIEFRKIKNKKVIWRKGKKRII